MIRRLITLSDGTRVPVSLGAQRCWYPDVPHCCVCDQAQDGRHRLWTCDAAVTGKTNGRCGRYVCGMHRASVLSLDYCPAHASRPGEGC